MRALRHAQPMCNCVCRVCVCCVWVSLLLFHAFVVVAVCICIGIPLVWFAFACKNFRNSAEDARACGRITLGVAVEFPWKRGRRKPGVACQLMLHIHALISAGFHHLIWLTRPTQRHLIASIRVAPQFNLPTSTGGVAWRCERKVFTLSPFQQVEVANRRGARRREQSGTGHGFDYGWLHKSIQFVINFKLFILY